MGSLPARPDGDVFAVEVYVEDLVRGGLVRGAGRERELLAGEHHADGEADSEESLAYRYLLVPMRFGN